MEIYVIKFWKVLFSRFQLPREHSENYPLYGIATNVHVAEFKLESFVRDRIEGLSKIEVNTVGTRLDSVVKRLGSVV